MKEFSPATLGRQLKSLEAGEFILTEAANLPLASLPAHAHALACITFVLKGACIEMIGTHTYECGPLSAIIKPAGEVHSNRYGSAGARCLIVEVKPERLQAVRSFSPTLDRTAHLRDGSFAAFAVRLYREFNIGDSAALLSIEGLMLEVLAQVTRRNTNHSSFAPPQWLPKAKELCDGQFAEPISLRAIADAVSVHPAHLARMFRKHYHCTVGEYVRQLRLNSAAQELTRSDKSLTEIASESGFYDQSHFTHTFKLHLGMTPTEYRLETKRCNANTNRSGFPKT